MQSIFNQNHAPGLGWYERAIEEATVLLRSLEKQFKDAIPFGKQWHYLRRDIRIAKRELQAMAAAHDSMTGWPCAW